ncbi:HET domain protein [Hypoxylon sp. NC1633]|nr:HET domain protein [Hypoxylon sp. NC1633]
MRLLICETLTFQEFFGSQIPKYAILSHTWGEEEVLFQDFGDMETAKGKKGWSKIEKSCEVALKEGYHFMWIDTCCINKESSTELTEAINSMFQWYQYADTCYAYIADHDTSTPGSSLAKSRWFTRGWTLQELIAPSVVKFFDCNWKEFGTRDKMRTELSSITLIGTDVLKSSKRRSIAVLLDTIPVARRMAWAAARQTTRIEDIAYCLLGIFQVTMPLVYGEGERAFIRLQEEIIKKSNDLTLFAWTATKTTITSGPSNGHVLPIMDRGILATSPREFAEASKIRHTSDLRGNPGYSVSNRGLRIKKEFHQIHEDRLFMGLLCRGESRSGELGITLQHVGHGNYARTHPERLERAPSTSSSGAKPSAQSIFINLTRQVDFSLRHMDPTHLSPSFYIGNNLRSISGTKHVDFGPKDCWDESKNLFLTYEQSTFVGYYRFGNREKYKYPTQIAIVFGFSDLEEPWVCIATNATNHSVYNATKEGDFEKMASLGAPAAKANYTSVTLKLTRSGNSKESVRLNVSLDRYISDGLPICVLDVRHEAFSTSMGSCVIM